MNKIAAIIGGGVIGGGWAARFALSGWDVAIFDPDPEAARKIDAVMANARRSLPALSDVALPLEGQIRFVPTLAEAVTDADWIQESAPERLEIKQRILKEIQSHCRADALIGSSTSGFKPSELQQGALRAGQIFVAHPFNPVYLLPLVELVGNDQATARAADILTQIGMKPLTVRKEIDAHIADRLLEAVWREALWLVKDGIATTAEIDDAIRFGFGLRWGQMGLFETYRVAGGEAGMAHFIAQFGPCLQWPWTKLTDVPELTDELVQTIAGQSDAQSGRHNIRELERIRDDNLVSMMRSLKGRNWGAGALLNEHDTRLSAAATPDLAKPIISVDRVIPVDWSDYNGHMNESRYGQVWSDAADTVMRLIGADANYVASGLSYFTVDTHTKFINECHVGDAITVSTQILEGAGKKVRLFHEMKNGSGAVMASCTQLLIHVSLETRKSCDPAPKVLENLRNIMALQAPLHPEGAT
ncbi:carnitine 3-dehydrogenase [Loktanella salsilacus]|uniref:carnitine 3-dehydrogenase n=1 Tax=Loktanella salsilacus TaxID=195913 RepID=UPI00373685FD